MSIKFNQDRKCKTTFRSWVFLKIKSLIFSIWDITLFDSTQTGNW